MIIEELRNLGMQIGDGCKISPKCSIYNPSKIKIGDRVRIDDFTVLSAGEGGIDIGNHVHISVYTSLQGRGKITFGDFVTTSSRVAIYSSNDDYSGKSMTNPMVGEPWTNVHHEDVVLEDHVLIGAGTVILPGTILKKSVCIGSHSLVKAGTYRDGIYVGVPIKYIKQRYKTHLSLAELYLNEFNKWKELIKYHK